MIWRILKKDMTRRKSVNMILFLFVMLASIFLSSSLNNILVVVKAIDYYMDYANVPDINFITAGIQETGKIEEWLDQDAPGVKGYDYNTLVKMNEKEIAIDGDGAWRQFDSGGIYMYLGTMDADYCKVFGPDGEDISLEPGEIAVSQSVAKRNDLRSGGRILIGTGPSQKEYVLKTVARDAAYGSDVVGMSRILMSGEDYAAYREEKASDVIGLFYVDTPDGNQFLSELNDQDFTSIMNSVARDTYRMVYSFDMIMAALLIAIGICLILIALLVLRFTLVFTIEEDYREIGIMKALGLRELSIRGLYLIKYFFLVSAGALLGLAASIPVSREMVKSVSKNILMEDASANFGVNVMCTLSVIILVLLFCYGCTRKLSRVSAVSAIRDGHSGERYKRSAAVRLHKRKWLPVPVYLGINDMASHVRRYLVLMVTFCLSFVLITIPLNTLNTMQSREMTEKFVVDPDCAVCVRRIEAPGEAVYDSSSEVKKGMERLEGELLEQGYHAEITAVCFKHLRYMEKGKSGSHKIMTVYLIGPDKDFLTYNSGTAPVLENEVAFSRKIMEQNGWQIGDLVEMETGDGTRSMTITGVYSDYMNMGESARMNPRLDLGDETALNYWNFMVNTDTRYTQKEMVSRLLGKLPGYDWVDAQAVVDQNVGGIQQSLKDMLIPMTGMLCTVIMLIIFLMERLFIVREKGEIAMMKSIGFKERVICLWQVLRMVFVALFSMILAVPLSFLTNQFVLKPIFAIMGAEVQIQVVPWMVYGVFPGVLLICIIFATVIGTLNLKKINIREINNME